RPALASDPTGDMVLTSSAGADENYAIHAERFAAFTNAASITGQLWRDSNGNGVRDSGETAPGTSCTVNLFNNFMLMSSVTTTLNFSFSGVMPGESLYVQLSPPTGFFLTLYNAGGSAPVSSQIDPATGRSATLTLAADQSLSDFNIGLIPAATIVGSVFSDLLSDGTLSGGDAGLPGKTVYLDSNGNGILDAGESSQLTDFKGGFSFSLPPGNYTLRVVDDGTNVDPAPVETASVVPAQRLTVNIPIHSLKAVPAPAAAGAAGAVGPGSAVDVATDAAGDSVIAYKQTSGTTTNIFAQRFSSTGAAVAGPFRVNTSNLASDEAQVGIANDGSFVVAWRGGNVVRAQRYAADGTPVGGEMVVETPPAGDSVASMDLSMNAGGAFVVAWSMISSPSGVLDTFVRPYDAAGNAVTDVVQASMTDAAIDTHPSVAMGDDGSFFVLWQALDAAKQNQMVFGRRFDATGTPLAPQLAINTTTTGEQWYPSVSVNSSGYSAVVWLANAPPGVAGEGVYIQRYDAIGNAIGREMLLSIDGGLINHITLGEQGDMLVSWCPDTTGLQATYLDAAGTPHSFVPINDNIVHGAFGADMDAAGNVTFGYDTSGTVNVRRFVSRPVVLATNFQLTATPVMNFVLRLSSDVAALAGANDVTILNNNTSTAIPASAMAITAASDNTLTITFPGYANGELPSGSYTFTLPASKVVNTAGHTMSADFVSRFLWVAGTDAADTIIVRRASDKSTIQVFDNIPTTGSPSYTAPALTLGQFRIDGGGGDDTVTFDFTNGTPFTTFGFSYTGGSGSNSLLLTAATGVHSVVAAAASGITFDSTTVPFAVQNLLVDPAGGSDFLGVAGMIVTVPANAAGSGIVARTFLRLSVSAGGIVRFADAASPLDRTVAVVTSTSLPISLNQGSIDLGGNDMIIRSGNLATIASLLQNGLNMASGGHWNGIGIQSSTAAAHVNTALGVLQNVTSGSLFDRQTLAANDVTIKYTLNADADLNGGVDVGDLGKLATNYGVSTGATWSQGDFNYDGKVDVGDLGALAINYGQSLGGGAASAESDTAISVGSAALPPTAFTNFTWLRIDARREFLRLVGLE
ncbi:MAG TPA: SdrD B-like domain-containing protein, partial [Tepidisphaeraceae bacterium]|nr:SdrD B-like domain-containing protein [Tepidisphaeraceae bacterium]